MQCNAMLNKKISWSYFYLETTGGEATSAKVRNPLISRTSSISASTFSNSLTFLNLTGGGHNVTGQLNSSPIVNLPIKGLKCVSITVCTHFSTQFRVSCDPGCVTVKNRCQFGYVSSIDFSCIQFLKKQKNEWNFFPPFLPYPFKSGRVKIFWPFLGWAKIKARFKGQKSIQGNCCIFNTRNEWSSSWKVPKS